MDIVKKIEQDFIESYKKKDTLKVSVLRMLKSSIQNKKIEKGEELAEEDILKILKKELKSREESAQDYRSGGREDLAEQELEEAEIIKEYLPQQLDENEIETLVDGAIKEAGANDMSDMGKVMGIVMPKVAGKADGGLVSDIVKQKLS